MVYAPVRAIFVIMAYINIILLKLWGTRFITIILVIKLYLMNLLMCCSWTAITQLAHHGMLYVPIGYTFGAGMFKMESIRGGSPYGAGVFSGDGTREPSDTELALAEHQGKYMAGIVKRFAKAS